MWGVRGVIPAGLWVGLAGARPLGRVPAAELVTWRPWACSAGGARLGRRWAEVTLQLGPGALARNRERVGRGKARPLLKIQHRHLRRFEIRRVTRLATELIIHTFTLKQRSMFLKASFCSISIAMCIPLPKELILLG